MGDACDSADIDRFLRCAAGVRELIRLRAVLKGRTILDVDFINETNRVDALLTLTGGERFVFTTQELSVEALREAYGDALMGEYYNDFPERGRGR